MLTIPLSCSVLAEDNLHGQSTGWLLIQEVSIHFEQVNHRSSLSFPHSFVALNSHEHTHIHIHIYIFIFICSLFSQFGLNQERIILVLFLPSLLFRYVSANMFSPGGCFLHLFPWKYQNLQVKIHIPYCFKMG